MTEADAETGAALDVAAEVAARTLAAVVAGLPGGGEARPGQEVMARAVAESLAGGRHLVVQAGTGTGKSLAYLVPAALSGKRVVVATATKALQDQLAQNDLPQVAAVIGRRFSFAVLKGRNNYLCRQRALEVSDGGVQPQLSTTEGDDELALDDGAGDSDVTPEDPTRLVDQVRALLAWAERSPTGDRADLSFEPLPRAWAMVSVAPRECPGAFRCPSGGTCFAEAARANAAAADVVVVNTHLYGAHLASDGAVLPEHDIVIFDEAHELEGVMTASLGVELSPGRLRMLGVMARPLLGADDASSSEDLIEIAERLAAALADRVGTRVLGADRADDAALADVLGLAGSRLDRLVAALRRAERDGAGGDKAEGVWPRLWSASGHVASDLARLAARSDDEVAWVDGTRRAPLLRLSPIDVGPALSASLWGEVTAVLTSATIPPRSPERLGIDRSEMEELDVGSPFDYRTHALLYVARHLPDRRTPEAEPALLEELEALIGAAGGRTLALFTSRRTTELAASTLGPRLTHRVLVQGQLPKSRLLALFGEDETSCLFATMSFWQGVDIPGRSLSLVVLDRLPFPRPGDPLTDAKRERAGDAAFRLVDLPRAATLLAQGAGRLIRSSEDRGVVAVLDSRLATSSYRNVLLAGLPPMRRTTDRRQVVDFLARALGPESAAAQ
jgi:ATP-dependent DNA helicase DinG